jgi:hypothetical protein
MQRKLNAFPLELIFQAAKFLFECITWVVRHLKGYTDNLGIWLTKIAS